MKPTCCIDHCGQPHMARGWCRLHYFRWRRHGDPQADIPVREVGLDRTTRVCSKCGVRKPVDDFGIRSKGKYRRSRCKPCESEDTRLRLAQMSSADRVERSEAYWRSSLIRNYGITHEEYAAILAAQGGGCGICGSTKAGGRRSRLAVDHCHETGEVRGILCDNCNRALGLIGDDMDAVLNALSYLDGYHLTSNA